MTKTKKQFKEPQDWYTEYGFNPKTKKQKNKKFKKTLIALALVTLNTFTAYAYTSVTEFQKQYTLRFTPIFRVLDKNAVFTQEVARRSKLTVEKPTSREWLVNQFAVKEAKAEEILKPEPQRVEGCDDIRPVVQKYFGELTEKALFVSQKESGCTFHVNTNRNLSKDFCPFQINNEPKTMDDLDHCVKRAYEKYVEGRMGEMNWSAFYSVCKRNIDKKTGRDLPPTPVYPNIIKNCI